MLHWKQIVLGDFIITNKNTIGKNNNYSEIKYLETGSITRGKITNLIDISLKDAPSRAKRILEDEDIIYSAVRPANRHYGFFKKAEKNLVVSTGFITITCKKETIFPLFLYYYLIQNFIVEQLDSIAEGSTSAYPSLLPSDIETLEIFLPPLAEQKAIAAVLSSLDDKIDLLHRQNATLERMAETLFRQWFIEEAEEGWEEKTLGDVVEICGGSTPSTKEPDFWNGNIFWTSPRDLADLKSPFLFSTERKISEKGLAKISSGLLPKGTLLLSSRAPIGYLAISEIEVAINQGYIAILNNDTIPNYFMFLWCKYNMEEIKAAGNGSVFQEISKSVFRTLSFTCPPLDLVKKFCHMIEPLFRKICFNQQQIRTLEKLRDTLLPKLMSGEVRVRVAE